MKLVAMLRIKNQILTIRECLDRLNELVDEIVIVDNGSTDGTVEVYKQYSKIVTVKHTKGFNEGRDKILAHELAKKRNPDWVLWIDGDEVFEDALTRADMDNYMSQANLNLVNFRLFHFWKSKTHYRVDGKWAKYTSFPQRMMWRETGKEYFRDLKFHNGGIMGVMGKCITSRFRLKHFGYIDSKQIQIKYKNYNQMKGDPNSFKTMPMDENGLRMSRWKEYSNFILLNLYLASQKIYWDVQQKIRHLPKFF